MNSRRRSGMPPATIRKDKEPFYERILQEEEQDSFELQNLGMTDITAMVFSEELISQLKGTKHFGNISFIQKIPFESMLESTALPRVISFLSNPHPHQLQMEAASTMANLIWKIPNATPVFINHGAIPELVRIIESYSTTEIHKIKAITALNNVSAYSMETRNAVLNEGALILLCSEVISTASKKLPSICYIASHTIRTLCYWRLQDREDLNDILTHIMTAAKLQIHSNNDIIVSKGVSILAHLANESEMFVNAIYNSEHRFLEVLMGLLNHESSRVVQGTLKCFICMASHSEFQTQILLDISILESLEDLIAKRMTEKEVMKNVCWLLSNINAGGVDQIQDVITAGFIPRLVFLLRNAEFLVKIEAVHSIANAVLGCSNKQLPDFVGQGCIEAFCHALSYSDLTTIENCLQAIAKFLSSDKWVLYGTKVVQCGGQVKIERLRRHENVQISNRSRFLFDNYLNTAAMWMVNE